MSEEDTRPFPIQGGVKRDDGGSVARPVVHLKSCDVPWWLAEEAYKEYHKRYRGQTLERLAERGGFGRTEFLSLLRGGDGGHPRGALEPEGQ